MASTGDDKIDAQASAGEAGRAPASARGVFAGALWSLRLFFVRLVDSGVPPDLRKGDPDELRRARIILSFALVLLLLGLETGFFFAWMLEPVAAVPILGSLAISMTIVLLIPAVFRRGGSLALGANMVIFAAFLVTVCILSVLGGIHSPLVHWCALFPMLAAFMGARRSAWVWAGVSTLTVVLFIVADALAWGVRDIAGLSSLDGPALWFQRFVNIASWLGILLAVAMLFEDHSKYQNDRLLAKNAELQAQVAYRNRAEERSQYLAYYDELTGLPNRRLFMEQLSTAMDQASRSRHMVSLLFLDLDSFKEVNDMHGHALGDQLLQQVAQRLYGCLRQSDRLSHGDGDAGGVARLGGDEFTILLNGIRRPQDASLVAQRIIQSLRQSFVLDELELFIGASIGIALYDGGDMQSGDLLRNADLAMYQAKNSGKNNYAFHHASMNADIVHRSTLTDALRRAIEADELELHYQPILSGDNRQVIAVKGLVRWVDPDNGAVPTDTVIGIAEESGLIIPLGDWVIREGCRQFQAWRRDGIFLERIAINISAEQFRRGGIVETVTEALRNSNMSAGCLELEITEGAMMVDEEKTLYALEELRAMGVKIALDDFGTGYSSLSYVHRFPVDRVKIDRSFVTHVEQDEGARAIAIAVIALAHQMDMAVVAEGIESVPQEQFLLDHGCDELQGYLYSRPVAGADIQRLLGEREVHAVSVS